MKEKKEDKKEGKKMYLGFALESVGFNHLLNL